MTIEKVLEDIRSDRKKKVIVDGDFAGEIDDQYAFAYAAGNEKLEVLGVNASAHFDPPENADTAQTVKKAFHELMLVLNSNGLDESYPAFMGAESQISNNKDYRASDSPAARNIIKQAMESDELIYVFVTGPCTNVVSACLMEPAIMEKICVVWLACVAEGNEGGFHEWNLFSDYAAGQYLMNLDVPVVLLPCDPHGSADIVMDREDLEHITGDSDGAVFFRKTLADRIKDPSDGRKWYKVMCDFAAPALLCLKDAGMKLEIKTAPVITDDQSFAYDKTRKKIIYGWYPNSQLIVDDAMASIDRFVNHVKIR